MTDPKLEAAIEAEISAQAADPRHPTRIAYDRARAAFPNGGEEARSAFHRFLREERAARDATVDRGGQKAPTIGHDGVPMCSGVSCPKYAKFQGRCTEDNVEGPGVCAPAVRDMVLELDARRDAADPAFDEIVKLCGLAKTWEYPAQVVRDVDDALKERDGKIAAVVEQNQKLQACIVYVRDRRSSAFDFDTWIRMVEHALDNKIPPGELENAQGVEHMALQAVTSMRKDRDAMKAVLRHVVVYTKHGPRGSGLAGPCDAGCAKCHAEAAIKGDNTVDPLQRVEKERAKEDLCAENADLEGVCADRDLWKQRATVDWSKGPYGVAPGQEPGEIRVTARNLADENRRIREERTADLHVMTAQGKVIEELREKVRIVEIVRDDARAASQRRLDENRVVVERLRKAVMDWRIEVDKLEAEKRQIANEHEALIAATIQGPLAGRTVHDEIVNLRKQKDGAYDERDRCVAGLAALAVRLGWSVWLGKHPADEKWDDDWRWIVFINLPTGQVSWHIHDSEVQWFGFLTHIPERPWDGHTTEQKYKRLAQLSDVARHDDVNFVPGHGKYDPKAPLYDRLMTYVEPDDDSEDRGTIRLLMTEAAQALHAVLGAAEVSAERAWLPFKRAKGPAATVSPGQCLWVMPDGDPDEGYWHCKLPENHEERHVTEFGRGLDKRWYLPCEDGDHTFVGDCCRDCALPVVCMPPMRTPGPTLGGEDLSPDPEVRREQIRAVVMGENNDAPLAVTLGCSCSPKYIELAPGVHAKYCALAGTKLDDGRRRWRCEPCKLTWRAAEGEVTPIDHCISCGGPTAEVL